MNSTEASNTRLPVIAAVIYLGILFLVLVADPFGTPEKLPRESKTDAPISEVFGDNEGFGWSAAGGIDLDGDGVGDLIVCSPMGNEDSQYRGQGHVLSTAKKAAIYPPITSAWPWSSNMATAKILGDLDKDGSPEIAFGLEGRENRSRRGQVQVVAGKSGKTIFTVENVSREEQFGKSVCAIDDLDLDGINDIAVGAPGTSKNSRPGVVYLFSGKDGTLLGNIKLSNRSGNRFGYSLAFLGDTNGDGHGELIVGAPGTSRNGYHSGSVLVYTLGTGKILRRHEGQHDGDRLGTATVSLSDHNGDGIHDYAVTTCSSRLESSVHVFSGTNGTEIFSAESANKGDRFGFSLCRTGDLNGDRISDLAIGAPFAPHMETPGVGYVRLINGKDGSLLKHIRGTEENEHFGFAVAPAGDQDGDGKADVFVTSPMSDGRKGRVAIFGLGQAKEK